MANYSTRIIVRIAFLFMSSDKCHLLRNNGDLPKLVVDFLRENKFPKKKNMEIVEPFVEKYNNNDKS